MKALTEWGEKINRECPLSEYPRPYMQRDSYFCLNGQWEYQITERNEQPKAGEWKSITVPFALGSLLSGSEEELKPKEALWYRKQFAYRPNALHTILHFEAVDNQCIVIVNGIEIGLHKGGYTPFAFDISDHIKYQNSLMLKVVDDSEYNIYSYGKQRTDHSGMWYTPSAGIWGTVWIEDIPPHAIEDIKVTPDYDHSSVHVDLSGDFDQAVVTVSRDGRIIHSGITNDKSYTAKLETFHPWSPDDPYLYDLFVSTDDDVVRSYFGMRKFSSERDSTGVRRFFLNNKPLFLTGLLDQGYTSDGLMTYPSDVAMIHEISTLKAMGFNMLRKHVKIENRRWYYHCDRLGMLVMQDMVSGGFSTYDKMGTGILPTLGINVRKSDKDENNEIRDARSKNAYYEELDDMLSVLYNATSIFAWCPFNEGWGQFDAVQVTRRIRNYDRTRLIDSTSGWFDQGCGDFHSIHNYFFPYRPKKDKHDRITILSEFGGYSYQEPGHESAEQLYGYKKFTDKRKLNDAIIRLYENMILANIRKGLSGCIYTQVSDIEDECNGIFTYDRRVVKVDMNRMRRMNGQIIRRLKK